METRREQVEDHTAVGLVHQAAFGGQDGSAVAALTESLRLRLRASDVSLVAVVEGDVVGHVMITASLLDAPTRLVEVGVLSPVSVLPGHQRRGIGSALIQQAVASVSEAGIPLVFLEGDPGYYSRLGFEPAGPLGFGKPSVRIPDRAFQVLRLAAFEPWMTGALVYSEPFWTHDCVGLREH